MKPAQAGLVFERTAFERKPKIRKVRKNGIQKKKMNFERTLFDQTTSSHRKTINSFCYFVKSLESNIVRLILADLTQITNETRANDHEIKFHEIQSHIFHEIIRTIMR